MPSVRSSTITSERWSLPKRVEATPRFAGAACASHAMDEVFRDIRQVVIDHVRDVLHVNPAGSQVGGHQHAVASLLKSSQRCDALRLRTVAMNHGRGKSFAAQIPGQPLGSALGARENQAAAGFLGQQSLQHFLLAVGGHFESLEARTFSDGFKIDPNARRTGFLM